MVTKPTVFKPIGTQITRQGKELVVVERPKNLYPRHACAGCFFNTDSVACNTLLQCSSFDRQDATSVWFKRIDK